jgi:outer membrane protein, heavy metal efflux system
MFLARAFCAGLCVCTSFSVWAEIGTSPNNSVLAIAATTSEGVFVTDTTLPTFIQQVWAESPVIRGALANVEAARARSEGADRPLHNPSLAFDSENSVAVTNTLGMVQTIDWSDKRGAQLLIAQYEQKMAQAELQEARQRIAVESLSALANFFTARDMQTLAQRRMAVMKNFVDTAKRRQAAGDMRALGVTLAQVAYSEALMTMASIESILAEAEAGLQAVSGLVQKHWPVLPKQLPVAPAKAEFVVLDTLPVLLVLRQRMEAAKARILLAQKQGRSDPTVGIRAGREDSENLWGVSLEIPLFVRNNFSAQIRSSSQQAIVEEQRYRDAYRRAKAKLQAALARYQNTHHAWNNWLAYGAHAQREQMNLLEKMWQAGELSVTDYLMQVKQNIDTQQAATLLMGETRQAYFVWLATSNQVESSLGLVRHGINSGEAK